MPKKTSKLSYIYLMAYPGGIYKIGCSDNPTARLKTLDVGPFPLELCSCTQVPFSLIFQLERKLHVYFSKEHLRHEWFQLTREQVQDFGVITKYFQQHKMETWSRRLRALRSYKKGKAGLTSPVLGASGKRTRGVYGYSYRV